jgi:RNA polymerase sigma factor (sigma-70 family)
MLQQSHTNEEQQQLWIKFLEGDASAFGQMIKHIYQDLCNYGLRFSNNTELVKDAIQELCLELWKNRTNLSITASPKNYILKSLRRKLIREAGKSRQSVGFDEEHFDAGFNMVLPVENDVILQEKLTELSFKVRSILEKLSKRQQEIIYLRFYLEVEVEQISDIMDLNRQSVYNLLHDALKRFKSLSGPEYFSFCITLILMLAVLHP